MSNDTTALSTLPRQNGLMNQPPPTQTDIDIFRLGEVFAKSGYFTDARDAAQAVVKILAGREIGIGAMASMTGFHIVQGKPTLSANLIASIIKSQSPRYNYKVLQLTEIICEIEFYENGKPVGKSSFTMQEAQTAGLTGKDVWRKFPKNMLFARAISNGAKWYCPDVFNGATVYTPEELGANVNDDGEVIAEPVNPFPVEAEPQNPIRVKLPPQMQSDNVEPPPALPTSEPPQTRFQELQQQREDSAPVSRETKGRLLFEGGFVAQTNAGYDVTETIGDQKVPVQIVKHDNEIKCSCDDYRNGITETANFYCAHKWALKFYVEAREAAKQQKAA